MSVAEPAESELAGMLTVAVPVLESVVAALVNPPPDKVMVPVGV